MLEELPESEIDAFAVAEVFRAVDPVVLLDHPARGFGWDRNAAGTLPQLRFQCGAVAT